MSHTLEKIAAAQAKHDASHKRLTTGSRDALTPAGIKKWALAFGVVVVPLVSAIVFMYTANISAHAESLLLMREIMTERMEEARERVAEVKSLCGLPE